MSGVLGGKSAACRRGGGNDAVARAWLAPPQSLAAFRCTVLLRPRARAALYSTLPADVFKSSLMGGLMEAGWPSSGARNLVRFTSRVKQVRRAARASCWRRRACASLARLCKRASLSGSWAGPVGLARGLPLTRGGRIPQHEKQPRNRPHPTPLAPRSAPAAR